MERPALSSLGPRKFMARISRIAIYPIKGCGMVELRSASVSPGGFQGDREYMVVRDEVAADGAHHFLTQRDKRGRDEAKPQSLAILALIRPEVSDGALRLTWKGDDPIQIPRDGRPGREMRVKVHADLVYAVDQGDSVAGWLSDHLDLRVRLVRAAGAFSRLARQNFMRNPNPIMFHDAYPIHWIMQESLDELSRVVGQPVPWTRFRPNILAEGGEPQSEHEILDGTIGEVRFVQPKPCTRCPVVTVDQEEGEKKGNQPLTALTTYKRWEKTREVLFGENMLPLNIGTIRVGDDICELSARSPKVMYGT